MARVHDKLGGLIDVYLQDLPHLKHQRSVIRNQVMLLHKLTAIRIWKNAVKYVDENRKEER